MRFVSEARGQTGMQLRWTLEARLAALLLVLMATSAALATAIDHHVAGRPQEAVLWAAMSSAGLALAVWGAHRALRPVRRLLRALGGAVASYRDGDFGFSLRLSNHDQFGELCQAVNELGDALREQRAHLSQRELLLDTVTQNSPVALLLVDSPRHIVYANLAARHLLGEGRGLTGRDFAEVLGRAPEALQTAIATASDTLFSVEIAREEETFHLSQRSFLLQGAPHRLFSLKRLTRELSRQEVATWKRLIRVLSHELNNSLAPIASLAQTGGHILGRGDTEPLAAVFATIEERARHLHQFISGYAAFARLPAPRPTAVPWPDLCRKLLRQQPCRLAMSPPQMPGWFDRGQLEQVLINLLKNAHEAGGPAEEVELAIYQAGHEQYIEVRDRGAGMSETVLAQALLPFYSTKRQGTGLGLALAREILEAHGGRIRLENRPGGGMCVTLMLPCRAAAHEPWRAAG